MSDRPLTLIFISVAILVALWLRRARPITPVQAKAEGAKRGVNVELSQPISREMFEELLKGG